MFEKKCKSCAKKVDKKFNYCPYCGGSLKSGSSKDFGMLGASDEGEMKEDQKLPFGMEKIMGGLVRQLEKQLGNLNIDERTGMPKGFRIQIATNPMGQQVVQNNPPKERAPVIVSKEEMERRAKLDRVSADSKIKRLGDVILYEIDTPGVKKKEDIIISELETGIEVRAYSKDKCYIKVIPLKVESLNWRVGEEKVFVEFKG